MATPPQVHQATLTGHALQTRHQNLTATVGLSPARPCSLHALAARTEHAAAQRWGWEGNHAISSAAGGAAVPCERALRVVLSGAANFPFPTCWGPLLSTNHAPPKPPCILDLHVAGAVALVRIRVLHATDVGGYAKVLSSACQRRGDESTTPTWVQSQPLDVLSDNTRRLNTRRH